MTPNIRSVRKPDTREEWLALRKTHLGWSEVGAAMGLSPFKTPYQLWLEKTGRAEPETSNPEALRLGQYLEQYAADRYAEETGRLVRNHNFMLFDDVHHTVADIDRLVVPDGEKIAAHQGEIRTDTLLECKSAGVIWDDQVPAHYQVQVQGYLYDTGCLHADFAVVWLAPRREFACRTARPFLRVERDDGMIDGLLAFSQEWFEKHILHDEAPDPVNEEDCKKRFWRSKTGEVMATPRLLEVVDVMRSAQARADKAEEDIDLCRTEIMQALGEADTLVGPDGRKLATWKSTKDRETTDWKSVAEALGRTEEPAHVQAIVAANTTTKPGNRVFRVAK